MSSFLAMMPGHRALRPFFEQVNFDPLTIATVVVSAAGSIQKGNAEAASYKSQSAADTYNAKVERMNETATNETGTQRELQTRTSNALKLGEARASVGEANIGGPQGGTIAEALHQDTVNAELNALGVRYQRDTTAAGYEDSARQQDFQAQVAKSNAKQAKIAGYIGAVGSVVGGASRYENQQALLKASAPPSSSVFSATSNPSADYGPFDNSLPWRNQPVPYTLRGGAF